jgi:site-specific recombinase XerD
MDTAITVIDEVGLYIIISKEDAECIERWIRLKQSPSTQKAYFRDVRDFLMFVQKPLQGITEDDILNYMDWMDGKVSVATCNRKLAAIKSLFTYATRKGYTVTNAGLDIKLKQPENKLAERILSIDQVFTMFVQAKGNKRNHAILRLLYYSGIRVAELCGLKWRNVQARDDLQCGQITVYGKGNKTRSILISKAIYDELLALRLPDDTNDSPVFKSRKHGYGLLQRQVEKIVLAAANKAGIGLCT